MCWIARDKDGKLYVYNIKPKRYKEVFFVDFINDKDCFNINSEEFPEVTWENSPFEITSLKGVENV